MTNQPHFFIAVPINEKMKEKLGSWLQQSQPPFQKFVHEKDFHITLAFLGGVAPKLLEQLKGGLQTVSEQHPPFSLTIQDLGFFGQKAGPRIFWAGVKHEQKLFDLQKHIYETCVNVGIDLEKRAYSPHITLARKYIGDVPYNDQELKQSFFTTFKDDESWRVSSFVIYQTHLNRTPKYEVVASFQLE
ncbi:RNA 2',3'-cyclic phosphodiesterase [Anaerobacillus alkaliphilus]|uniref:RNA 2',3'-cyclic phosphodiesterase n=1 Tax=Anaerobacillus alkaliphilus TaxID=1548597 RepID=A0A4Q0VQC8_9BACI|nr:RNA 2',3'-cyclic phosphodiesterase [Anaerobacillus alkaliphilus]RXI98633.1 RNA 2',3'-cyclic phosphodiesterase [Anaerobacillus alkaliphilus]